MGKIKENKIVFSIVLVVFLLFSTVSFFILSLGRTTQAIVPIQAIPSGTIVTEDMITTIQIPASTPKGYLTQTSSIIGYTTKTPVEINQLLYESDFMSSWDSYTDMNAVPDDYAITSVTIPSERACGGIITAGNYVDVLLVSKYDDGTWNNAKNTSTEINGAGRKTGTSVTYVLSNVLILNTNSTLSQNQDAGLEDNNSSKEGNYYVMALSYDDLKKLRQAEGVEGGKLWLNICPAQNKDKEPLINQMNGNSYSFLHDAQKAVQDSKGKMLTDNYYKGNGGQNIEYFNSSEPTDENDNEEENTEKKPKKRK